MKQYLQPRAPHVFGITDPVCLEITNFDASKDYIENKEMLKYDFKLESKVWVDRADVRLKDDKKFFGIAPGKIVRLRYGPFIKITSVEKNKAVGELVEVENFKKIKGILHWIGHSEAMNCEVREYSRLFNTAFPGKRDKKQGDVDFLVDYAEDSKIVYKNAKFPKAVFKTLKKDYERFQFERKGYYVVDKDTDLKKNKLVFNQIVAMKQSKKKVY